MSIERRTLTVRGLPVSVVRKAIKNLHLGVYPPNGRIRVAAPLTVSDEAVRVAVVGKLGWIKRQQANFSSQPRQTARKMVGGESHYYLGRRYRLHIVAQKGAAKVILRNRTTLELHLRPDATVAQRTVAMHRWYRQQLKLLIPPLLKKWQSALGVRVAGCGIKKMKTRWGTCNTEARRIWLNLELAKKPVQCLEYILVHELVHLLERHHDDHFIALMNQHLPHWQLHRQTLNSEPLAHETWVY